MLSECNLKCLFTLSTCITRRTKVSSYNATNHTFIFFNMAPPLTGHDVILQKFPGKGEITGGPPPPHGLIIFNSQET